MEKIFRLIRAAILPLVFLLTACTVNFAPNYDADLVKGLDETNTSALTLFSAIDQGTTQRDYSKYSKDYDEIIGRFDSLLIRAKAREMPATSVGVVTRLGLSTEQCGELPNCINPTPSILQTLLSGLRRMREEHRNGGLPADKIAIYKNGYEISIIQAITVERAFER